MAQAPMTGATVIGEDERVPVERDSCRQGPFGGSPVVLGEHGNG